MGNGSEDWKYIEEDPITSLRTSLAPFEVKLISLMQLETEAGSHVEVCSDASIEKVLVTCNMNQICREWRRQRRLSSNGRSERQRKQK